MKILAELLQNLTHLDIREPVALLLYLGILGLLMYRYHREGADVFREFGRLHREILKEQCLRDLYTEEWKQRLGAVTHLFTLDTWLVFSSFQFLSLFVGVMILIAPPQNGGNTGISRPSTSLSTNVVRPAAPPAETVMLTATQQTVAGDASVTRTPALEPRAEAQRLLGIGFIVFCILVALGMNRTKYVAFRAMYEFSRQPHPALLNTAKG